MVGVVFVQIREQLRMAQAPDTLSTSKATCYLYPAKRLQSLMGTDNVLGLNNACFRRSVLNRERSCYNQGEMSGDETAGPSGGVSPPPHVNHVRLFIAYMCYI